MQRDRESNRTYVKWWKVAILMSQTFTVREELELESAAWRHFDCQPLVSGDGTKKDRKELKRRERKRREVSRASDQFFQVMNSEDPPRTEEEAVSFAIPIMAWLLPWLFRSLAVEVIRWLWSKTMKTL